MSAAKLERAAHNASPVRRSDDSPVASSGSRVSRNIRSRGAILRNLCREPFAPFQKFIVARALSPFLRPVFRARPKTEDSATGEIVNNLNIHQTVKNHVADYFHPKSELKNLAPRFCI